MVIDRDIILSFLGCLLCIWIFYQGFSVAEKDTKAGKKKNGGNSSSSSSATTTATTTKTESAEKKD